MPPASESRTPVVVIEEDRGSVVGGLLMRPGMSSIDQAGPVDTSLQWTAGGAALAITLWGSSSDPVVPISWSADNDAVELHVGRRHNARFVTADLAAHTTVIERPADLDPGKSTTVRIGDRSYELPR